MKFFQSLGVRIESTEGRLDILVRFVLQVSLEWLTALDQCPVESGTVGFIQFHVSDGLLITADGRQFHNELAELVLSHLVINIKLGLRVTNQLLIDSLHAERAEVSGLEDLDSASPPLSGCELLLKVSNSAVESGKLLRDLRVLVLEVLELVPEGRAHISKVVHEVLLGVLRKLGLRPDSDQICSRKGVSLV